ncbi:MAG TPA: hypothetical protein DGU37_04290, partial [Microbacterium sp.]|nr:hypothetical protein [Microbacterium sp.]
IDVLLVSIVLPRRPAAMIFARRVAVYNSEIRRIAASTGCVLLDLEAQPAISDLDMWADDKVHFRSKGHRFVAYRAAEALGVPYADELATLDSAFHDDDDPNPRGWVRRDAVPWLWRRLRGRTAGDGLSAKHADYVTISRRPATVSESPVVPDAGASPVRDGAESPGADPTRRVRP